MDYTFADRDQDVRGLNIEARSKIDHFRNLIEGDIRIVKSNRRLAPDAATQSRQSLDLNQLRLAASTLYVMIAHRNGRMHNIRPEPDFRAIMAAAVANLNMGGERLSLADYVLEVNKEKEKCKKSRKSLSASGKAKSSVSSASTTSISQ